MAETAIVVLFPELDLSIGELRRRFLADGAHGMPAHATLLYPFADVAEVDRLLPAVARALSGFVPFDVAVGGPARFPDMLYLQPEPPDPLVAMTEALVGAFPDFPPYGGAFETVVPHITVAKGNEDALAEAEAALPPLSGVKLRVERAWLMEDTEAAWQRHTAFSLNRRDHI